MQAPEGLDAFLAEVRETCSKFAGQKGYLSGEVNVLGGVSSLLGIERDHAIGEIVAKLIEFRRHPRKVVAAKIAGWAWRLWMTVEEESS